DLCIDGNDVFVRLAYLVAAFLDELDLVIGRGKDLAFLLLLSLFRFRHFLARPRDIVHVFADVALPIRFDGLAVLRQLYGEERTRRKRFGTDDPADRDGDARPFVDEILVPDQAVQLEAVRSHIVVVRRR